MMHHGWGYCIWYSLLLLGLLTAIGAAMVGILHGLCYLVAICLRRLGWEEDLAGLILFVGLIALGSWGFLAYVCHSR
jgi:hypothetical protein